MKWIVFALPDREADAFAADATVTAGLIAYVDNSGDEVELMTVGMSVEDHDPRES